MPFFPPIGIDGDRQARRIAIPKTVDVVGIRPGRRRSRYSDLPSRLLGGLASHYSALQERQVGDQIDKLQRLV